MKSLNNNFSFEIATSTWKLNNKREGESKLSENVRFGKEVVACPFVILGISEDIGPQMNNGLPGALHGFQHFCKAFQSIQSNGFLSGHEIGILGEIKQNSSYTSIESQMGWIEELDEFVFTILTQYISIEQTLIVIGGGHNNAYPMLKFAKNSLNKQIRAINIDPHADCRKTDFRHSGNPFSFALENGYLDSYQIIGLHQSYNNAYILEFIQKHQINANFFEDFLDDEIQFWKEISILKEKYTSSEIYTLDLDLDAIAFMPSSAFTPSGFTIEQSRKLIRNLSSTVKFKHFHLPEGSPQTEMEHKIYAKTLCYLVSDFIKCQNSIE